MLHASESSYVHSLFNPLLYLSPSSNTLSNPKIIGVILLFYKSEGREGMILNAIVWLINHLQMTTHI